MKEADTQKHGNVGAHLKITVGEYGCAVILVCGENTRILRVEMASAIG